MDIARVIAGLEQQRASIDRAISALREIEGSQPSPQIVSNTGKKRGRPRKSRLSPEGRRRIVEAAKKYWAERRAAKVKRAK